MQIINKRRQFEIFISIYRGVKYLVAKSKCQSRRISWEIEKNIEPGILRRMIIHLIEWEGAINIEIAHEILTLGAAHEALKRGVSIRLISKNNQSNKILNGAA